MGAEASQPVKKVGANVLRKAGEPLNTLGYQVVHEKIVLPSGQKPTRLTVCRCWQSLRFPLCDNTHQRLQKLGVNVGPVMVEIKPTPTPVSAEPGSHSKPVNLGGTALLGGAAAAGVAGLASWTGSFPL
mmetsp:Transcript_19673/g.34890  ORF Transcript_19673/g.34890 Transcript_19673/m.34890 type:complete len:129 (-) Transcript_19673:73-459(-)